VPFRAGREEAAHGRLCGDLFWAELPEVEIDTSEPEEFLVAALFDEPAAIHDQDVIAVRDGGQLVGDRDHGATAGGMAGEGDALAPCYLLPAFSASSAAFFSCARAPARMSIIV